MLAVLAHTLSTLKGEDGISQKLVIFLAGWIDGQGKHPQRPLFLGRRLHPATTACGGFCAYRYVFGVMERSGSMTHSGASFMIHWRA